MAMAKAGLANLDPERRFVTMPPWSEAQIFPWLTPELSRAAKRRRLERIVREYLNKSQFFVFVRCN
jgi:hypothetical protein